MADRAPTHPFERSHSILVAARPDAVFDYVSNPKTWPQWIASSHELLCDDRPMRCGDGSTSTGARGPDRRTRMAGDRLRRAAPVERADGDAVHRADHCRISLRGRAGGVRFTRTLRNPARPKSLMAEMIARVDAEAEAALAAIRRNVEGR